MPLKLKALVLFSVVLSSLAYAYFRLFSDLSQYPELSCKRHMLVHNGFPITGIEDMAYDVGQERVYASAYDRRKKTKGGIFKFDPQQINAVKKVPLPSPLWPHGFDLTRNGGALTLTLIDRKLDNSKQLSARIRQFEWNDSVTVPVEMDLPNQNDAFCNANHSYLVTLDHDSCHYAARKWENIVRPKSSSLTSFKINNPVKLQEELTNLYFANGIATRGPHIYIAETRKKRLSVLKANLQSDAEYLYLDGGPDNLTTDGTDIWAALHPDLIRFAAFRAGWIKRAPSRAARIGANGKIDLYDIPKDIISGATVALRAQDSLFLGSAFDSAIAVCDLSGEPHE